jgi:hypothetical protein
MHGWARYPTAGQILSNAGDSQGPLTSFQSDQICDFRSNGAVVRLINQSVHPHAIAVVFVDQVAIQSVENILRGRRQLARQVMARQPSPKACP